MSLVNLAHVCSHLQNASLARLGLTSIPYTKLHLSLALLLHKQGFLSQVKLGGASPPASAFPAALADQHHVTAAPHRDRRPFSAEAALDEVVYRSKTAEALQRDGFGKEEVDFAMEHSELTAEQLAKDGWDIKAIDFIIDHGHKSLEQLEEEGWDEQAIAILQQHNLDDAMRAVRKQLQRDRLDEEDFTTPEMEARLRKHLRSKGFSKETLAYFAGPARFTTGRHLRQDGITSSVMGLEVSGQPFATIPPEYRDPDALESESEVTRANRASRRLWVGLKYYDGLPVLSKAKMVSKPTKRIWLDSKDLGRVVRGSAAGEVKGLGRIGELMAVSTDKGVMDARECVERRIGGMALCRVW